jgi:hypothetical protein
MFRYSMLRFQRSTISRRLRRRYGTNERTKERTKERRCQRYCTAVSGTIAPAISLQTRRVTRARITTVYRIPYRMYVGTVRVLYRALGSHRCKFSAPFSKFRRSSLQTEFEGWRCQQIQILCNKFKYYVIIICNNVFVLYRTTCTNRD